MMMIVDGDEAAAAAVSSCTKNEIWKSKNLCLACGPRILGIKPSASPYTDGMVVEKAELVYDFDLYAQGYPIDMGLVVVDSNAYMAGGYRIRNDCDCSQHSHTPFCTPTYLLSREVFELVVTDGDLRLNPCDSIPKLRVGNPTPATVNIGGKIYMFYEDTPIYDRKTMPDLKECSVVLKKNGKDDNYTWSVLPTPPFYEKGCPFRQSFLGAIGNKLFVRSGQEFYAFDVVAEKWEQPPPGNRFHHGCGCMITLSIEQHCVVIYREYSYELELDISAGLLDGKGSNLLHSQRIRSAIPDWNVHAYDIKLFELEKEMGDDDRNSSTFCLVYISHELDIGYLVGLSVVKVSLLPRFFNKEEGGPLTKRQKLGDTDDECLDDDDDDPFLEVQVLEKRVYELPEDFNFMPRSINGAFFY